MRVDKELVKGRFKRSMGSYNSSAVVQLRLCSELAGALARWRVGDTGRTVNGQRAEQSDESQRVMSRQNTHALEKGGENGAGECSLVGASMVVDKDRVAGKNRVADRAEPPTIKRALELGSGTGALTRQLLSLYPDAEWYFNDIVEQSQSYLSPFTQGHSTTFISGDAEQVALPERLDLIASSSTIQWFADLPLFLNRSHKVLNAGGLLALSSFGERNFEQIRAITDRSLHYYTLDELLELLDKAGYNILESHQRLEQLHFPTPLDVLRHIRSTGANGIKSNRWSGADLANFESEYRNLYSTPNGVSLSYHPIVILAERI